MLEVEEFHGKSPNSIHRELFAIAILKSTALTPVEGRKKNGSFVPCFLTQNTCISPYTSLFTLLNCCENIRGAIRRRTRQISRGVRRCGVIGLSLPSASFGPVLKRDFPEQGKPLPVRGAVRAHHGKRRARQQGMRSMADAKASSKRAGPLKEPSSQEPFSRARRARIAIGGEVLRGKSCRIFDSNGFLEEGPGWI